MATDPNFGQHMNPVWRAQANYILAAAVDHMGDGLKEQLWGEQLDEGYRLCCIPFFAHELNLGDVVSIDDASVVQGVVRRSGHQTVRVWVDQPHQGLRAFIEELEQLGCLVEWYSGRLFAVDVSGETLAEKVDDALARAKDVGIISEFGDRF